MEAVRTSAGEPASKQWRIAWVHNGDAGGSKRFAYEMVRRLAARGHIIDEFIVRGSVFNGDYLPITPFVRTSSEVIPLRPDMSWLRPYLLSSIAELGATFRATRKVN